MSTSYRSSTSYRNIYAYTGNPATFQTVAAKARIGAPLITYDEPELIYDDSRYTYDGTPLFTQTTVTISGQAKILLKGARTISAKAAIRLVALRSAQTRARIVNRATSTLTARTNISNNRTIQAKARVMPTISARALISHRQGWPIPTDEDPGIFIFTDTRLYARTKIDHSMVFGLASLQLKSRIWPGRTQELSSRSRIANAGMLSARAHILPKWRSTHIPLTFSVQQVAITRATMVFYTVGKVSAASLSAGAYIVKTNRNRLTGHFLVRAPQPISTVVKVLDPTSEASMSRQLSIRAYITR